MANLLKGKSTAAAGNTEAQEAFISSLNTSGALDEGSGFERKFGAQETNPEYAARLEAWKKRGSGGAGGGGASPTSATAAVEGLQGAGAGEAAASSQPSVSMSGGGGPVDLPAVGALRQGLGQRLYPDMNSALAGLRRIY